MPLPWDDLDAFLTDFAVPVTLHVGGTDRVIKAIYDDPYLNASAVGLQVENATDRLIKSAVRLNDAHYVRCRDYYNSGWSSISLCESNDFSAATIW